MLTYGSLFAGIGGFDLGLERAGMRCLWQCEIDGFCQRVLEKHWPDVLRLRDVRRVGADTVPCVDVVCGGFPCQDISDAGKRAGIDGDRSGLWSEMFRVVDELRPRYVLVENVAALTVRGLDRVLGDLASIGFDAEWDCLRASDVGAPHKRDRIWIVAYSSRDLQAGPATTGAERERARTGSQPGRARQMADAERSRRVGAQADRPGATEGGGPAGWAGGSGWWLTEPDVGRVADGVPARVDRLRSLGNSLVPQIAEWIGRRIIDYEEGRLADVA